MNKNKPRCVSTLQEFGFSGFNIKRTPKEIEKLFGWKEKLKTKSNKSIEDFNFLVAALKNCGTGSGGFQAGNTCATGGGGAEITEVFTTDSQEKFAGFFERRYGDLNPDYSTIADDTPRDDFENRSRYIMESANPTIPMSWGENDRGQQLLMAYQGLGYLTMIAAANTVDESGNVRLLERTDTDWNKQPRFYIGSEIKSRGADADLEMIYREMQSFDKYDKLNTNSKYMDYQKSPEIKDAIAAEGFQKLLQDRGIETLGSLKNTIGYYSTQAFVGKQNGDKNGMRWMEDTDAAAVMKEQSRVYAQQQANHFASVQDELSRVIANEQDGFKLDLGTKSIYRGSYIPSLNIDQTIEKMSQGVGLRSVSSWSKSPSVASGFARMNSGLKVESQGENQNLPVIYVLSKARNGVDLNYALDKDAKNAFGLARYTNSHRIEHEVVMAPLKMTVRKIEKVTDKESGVIHGLIVHVDGNK